MTDAQPRWRHRKRGTTYVEIGRAELQSGAPVHEGTILVIYRADSDGRTWCRPYSEFYDGRFERMEDAAPAPDPRDADETSAALLARLDMDGAKWAAEFRETAIRLGYSDMDEGWLVGWFCNAIMAGWDERGRRPDPRDARIAELEAEVERLRIRIRELTGVLDVHYGTPCEQIRHQEEVERLKAEKPSSFFAEIRDSRTEALSRRVEKAEEERDAALSRARRAEDERAMAEWQRKRVEQERDAARQRLDELQTKEAAK